MQWLVFRLCWLGLFVDSLWNPAVNWFVVYVPLAMCKPAIDPYPEGIMPSSGVAVLLRDWWAHWPMVGWNVAATSLVAAWVLTRWVFLSILLLQLHLLFHASWWTCLCLNAYVCFHCMLMNYESLYDGLCIWLCIIVCIMISFNFSIDVCSCSWGCLPVCIGVGRVLFAGRRVGDVTPP